MQPDDVRTWIQESDDLADTYLGTHESVLGVEQHVGLTPDARRTHVLTVGQTGSGKSQLMTHAALQDAHAGDGFAIINPKGAMIDEVLAKLPEDRVDDIIYINPNEERVPAVNVLDPHVTAGMTPAERDFQQNIIVDDLTAVFRRLSQDWGERWGRNLRTLLRAHIHLNLTRDADKTLLDVFHCVTRDDALDDLLDAVNHSLLYEELQEIQALSDREMEPLQRRFRDFMESRPIRRVITQPDSDINFREVLADGKILFVDVQKGVVGPTAAALIGSIFLTKLWSAAQSRITVPEDERRPFYVYVDELQSFAGEGSNLQTILSEAREYRLSCWLSTQYLHQLETPMRRAVTNNCRSKIVFDPTGSEDLTAIARMLNGVDRETLTQLGDFRTVVQQPTNQQQQQATVVDTYPPWTADFDRAADIKEKVLEGYEPLEDQTAAVTGQKGTTPTTGGEEHGALLKAAHEHFTANGFTVNILHQDGETKPDGHIIGPAGERMHLEAERGSLSKPATVLRNLQRAVEQDRECVFVVEHGNAAKLANILDDPVNRRGAEHEDDIGTYSYYTDADGEAFTDIDRAVDAGYRIFEVRDADSADLMEFDPDSEAAAECPELVDGAASEAELTAFCLHRDPDGFCEKLGQPCVLDDVDVEVAGGD